jgi:hypothetical protein
LGRHQRGLPYNDPLPQGLPFQQLHDQERLTLVLTDIVNCADVGMIERTRGARLPLKAFQGLVILDKTFGQEF